MSRKRRISDDIESTADQQYNSCQYLFDRLQEKLAKRIRDTDDYVAEKTRQLEEREAACRAQSEEASKRLEACSKARELEVAQKERNLAQKTEELEALRAEVTNLYQDLIKKLPELQSRVQTLCNAPPGSATFAGPAKASSGEPQHHKYSAQQQPAKDQRAPQVNGVAAEQQPQQPLPIGQGAAGQAVGPQPDKAESSEQPWRQQPPRHAEGSAQTVDYAVRDPRQNRPRPAAQDVTSASAFASVDIRGSAQQHPQPQQTPQGPPARSVPGSEQAAVFRGARPQEKGGRRPAGPVRGFPFQLWRGRGRGRGAPQNHLPELLQQPVDYAAAEGAAPMGVRGGRRGRGRLLTGRGNGAAQKEDEYLDDAVKMLRAHHSSEALPAAHNSTNDLTDGQVPAAPAEVPHSNSAHARSPASMFGQPELEADAPNLVSLLKEHNLLQHTAILEPSAPNDGAADSSDLRRAELSELYRKVHNILGRILAAKRVEAEQPPAPGAAACPGPGGGGVAAAERRERYMLCALQCLIEAAKKYETASAPVRWGWCRELQAFVFVFRTANRIVVEKPEYGNACYFFDLEQPLPVDAQLERLVRVLSVPAVTRGALLAADGACDMAADLPAADAAVLRAAGWNPHSGLRALLNFSGERIIHKTARMASETEVRQMYRDRINKLLSQGAAAGRTFKPIAAS